MVGAVLVVDDEPLVRNDMVAVIEKMGMRAFDTYSGELALQVLAREPDIDLLITDIRMPGMDGLTLAEMVRESRPDVRIVLTSAYGKKAAPEGCIFLPKPWRESDLRALLNGLQQRDRLSGGGRVAAG
jgi:two-component system cell cycle sensor histidine kinase/response regulator CckA